MKTALLVSAFVGISLIAEASEFVSLFNEKDLHGWNIHGTERWYVENGELVCESGPQKGYGYLSTTSFYQNFDLILAQVRFFDM